MASDSRTERAGLVALLLRGLFCGTVTGVVVGLLDGLTSILAKNELVRNADVLHVVLVYAALFAPCGLVAALLATRFDWSRRATALLCVAGGALFFVGAFVNVRFLPSFGSWLSILFDLLLLVGVALWLRRAYHGPGDDEVRWGRWIAAAVACLFIAGLLHFVEDDRDGPPVSARAERRSERPNVLVFMVDTLRADALGCYGYDKPTSPEIDAFAADAVRFEDCRAPSSWTKPSVASLLTALYPTQHACVDPREVLVPEAETLAEVLRSAGYRTAAFTDNPFITPEFGFGQGFDEYDGLQPSVIANGTLIGKALFMVRLLSLVGEVGGVGKSPYRGAQYLVEDAFLPWLDARDEHPWFAYVHLMEPHLPYEPPRQDATAFGLPDGAPYRLPPVYNGVLPFEIAPAPPAELLAGLRAQYDGEVRDASRWFGNTLDALRERDLLESTVVVFVSDHGEELRDRGGWTHGHSLHRELLQVPLIIRAPDAAKMPAARAATVSGVASLLDVFPTVVELCGVKYPQGEMGRAGMSLATCLRADGRDIGPTDPPLPDVPGRRVLLAEVTMGPVRLRSLRDGRWLYMRATQPLEEWDALYDVNRDPDERRDQKEAETLEHLQVSARLDGYFADLAETSLTGRTREIDAETAKRLADIGYFGGEVTAVSRFVRAFQALSHRAVDLGVRPGGRDYVQFVLLGWYRTGSNYLRTLLDSHPQIVAYSELFSRHGVFWGTARARPLGAERIAARRDGNPLGFLAEGPFRKQPRSVRAVGFKLFYPQVLFKPVPGLAERLAAGDVRVVHLVRENLLRLRVSALVAAQTREMSSTSAEEAEQALAASGKIHADTDDLLEFFAQYRRRAAASAALFPSERVHPVVYEELAAEPSRVVAGVQSFLGVAARPAESPLVKQARRPLHEVVENWDELEKSLSGTEWAEFLDESAP